MADLFKIGDTINNFDEFYDIFTTWCTENFHPIHIEDSHAIQNEDLKKTIKFKNIHISCLHAGTWKRATTNKRKSKSFRIECPFGIKLACGKNSNVLTIKKANFEHNHETSEEMFSKYPKNRKPNSNEIDIISNLISKGCNAKKIVNEFRQQTKKPFTVQDLKNLVKKYPDMPEIAKNDHGDQNLKSTDYNINQTQLKRPRDLNLVRLQKDELINVCLRQIREYLMSLDSDELNVKIEELNSLVKSINEKTQSPKVKKIKLEPDVGNTVPEKEP